MIQAVGQVIAAIVRTLQATPLPIEAYNLIHKVVKNVVSSDDPVQAAARAVLVTGSRYASNKLIDETLKAKAKLEK